MAFRTLFDHGYEAYLEENHDRRDLWFFLHLPKTAGSSFRAELAGLLQPDRNIHAYGEDRDGSVSDRLQRAVARFIEREPEVRYRFASGHLPWPMAESFIKGPRRPRFLTMLRDPVKRVVSDFRYQGTPQHPEHTAFRARFPTIEAYLEADMERDKMLQYLAPVPDASVNDTVEHVLDSFTFIGAVETYASSFGLMMDLLGVVQAPGKHLRATEPSEAADVTVTPELLDTIRVANARDVDLYDKLMAFVRRTEAIRADYNGAAPPAGFTPWRDL